VISARTTVMQPNYAVPSIMAMVDAANAVIMS